MRKWNNTNHKKTKADRSPATIVVKSGTDNAISDDEILDTWTAPVHGSLVPVDDSCEVGLSLRQPLGKYPVPALANPEWVYVDVNHPAKILYPIIAMHLVNAGDVYRHPARGAGLIVVPSSPSDISQEVTTGAQLGVVIKERIPLLVTKNGKPYGDSLPMAELNLMTKCETFLGWFQPLDRIVYRPEFLSDFRLTQPGFNDGGEGQRVFYSGSEPQVLASRDTINRFLDVMAFASNADRTNAVAAALIVELKHLWPGQKPLIVITSTKSHGGKDTVLDFAKGETLSASISYESADWALQKAFVAAVKSDPKIGLVDIGNVRVDRRGEIASAFLERFLTDPNPLLHAIGTGPDVRRPNHWAVAMTTNFGAVSTDLMNRALPIHLCPTGDVAGRSSPIGNPRHEYLPANRDRIAAELRGMVTRWKETGCPHGKTYSHPMTACTKIIGGILEANGYTDFLGNYGIRRTADDPIREALTVLAVELSTPHKWMTLSFLVKAVAHSGVTDQLLPKNTRESPASRQRALAKVLDAHAEETFTAEAAGKRFRLERRSHTDANGPTALYRFADVDFVPDPSV